MSVHREKVLTKFAEMTGRGVKTSRYDGHADSRCVICFKPNIPLRRP